MKNTEQAPARRRLLPWAVTITLAGFVTGGGIAAAATMTGSTSASPPVPAAPAPTTAGSGASDLGTLLAASTNAPASTAHGRSLLAKFRAVGGMYGTITYRDKQGIVHTLSFERGTITEVTSSDVVVRAPDGTTMTWQLTSSTVVRQHGKATTAALHDGELVFAGGPVVNGAKDARLIVIRASKAVTS